MTNAVLSRAFTLWCNWIFFISGNVAATRLQQGASGVSPGADKHTEKSPVMFLQPCVIVRERKRSMCTYVCVPRTAAVISPPASGGRLSPLLVFTSSCWQSLSTHRNPQQRQVKVATSFSYIFLSLSLSFGASACKRHSTLPFILLLHISRLIMQHNWPPPPQPPLLLPHLILSSPDSAQPAQANFRGWHCWVLTISSSQWAEELFLLPLPLSQVPVPLRWKAPSTCPRSCRLQEKKTYFAWLL